MNNNEWEKIEAWLDKLIGMPPDQKKQRLEELKKSDHKLYIEVKKLTDAIDQSDGFLEKKAIEYATTLLSDLGIQESEKTEKQILNKTVGPYRLKEKLGVGGMGMVYLAERSDGTFERDVALKFIRSGLENTLVLERFSNEQKILASLNHPNIARLYDAGQDEYGIPFIIMEYVDGEPLIEYCKRENLSLADRLKLFVKICETVQFAHQNLVIHRDLKPSNIMINRDGEVKLLDFGIAKLLDPENIDTTQTISEMPFLSAAYASPEQIFGKPVSTATDVYTLGVILYELVSGLLPYKTETGKPAELIHAISTSEVQKPSTRLSKEGSIPEIVTGLQIQKLIRSLRGDLDNIILKAIAKEPARRYKSAEALADDIGRYLNNEPVKVRPATFGYKAGKFVSRNKIPVLALLLLIALSISGVLYHTGQLQTERDLARQQADRAESVAGFMTTIFEAANPAETMGETFTARDLLVEGMETARVLTERDPELYASFMIEIGKAWEAIGDYEKAHEAYQNSLEMRRKILPPRHPDIATALYHKADMNNRYIPGEEDPEEMFLEVLDIRKEAFGEFHPLVAETYYNLGLIYGARHNNDEARRYFKKTVDILEQTVDQDNIQLIDARADYAFILGMMGDLETASFIYEDVLEKQQQLLPEFHNSLITNYNNYGMILVRTGTDLERGYELVYKSMLGYEYVYGPDHLYPGIVRMTLSSALDDMGRTEEALEMVNTAIGVMLKNVAPNHPYLHSGYHRKASFLEGLGEDERAEYYYLKVIRITEEVQPPDHPGHAIPRHSLGNFYTERERFEEAIPLLEKAIEITENTGSRVERLGPSKFNLAKSYFYLGETQRAMPLFEELLPLFTEQYGAESEQVEELRSYLAVGN